MSNEADIEHMLATPRIQRVPTPKAQVFALRSFLNQDMCAQLINQIDSNRRPSTIADPNGDNYFRTSETCDLDMDDPIVAALDDRICRFSGIDPQFGETLQGQRYNVGQEFKAHTDYFEPNGMDYDKYCSVSGQRTWTFMIYLNDTEAGGATRFRTLGKSFHPETGRLLCWNNRRPDGSVNPSTIHHGMKVRKGVKYIITKWFREKPWG
ncbi:2OG-Fe(II) oxygenase [Sphingorhabdus sp. Alg239-R122]|uniref:prolyl hydroxylase family protein n=1 Tax=Sphingorhabdus sp. Alg239-R122 TaxID=2305989 RepID=UPI0013D970EB|nr:2OG-Fe(II) oxygenase [Sphingorhabdus sp. Alg239-R122]